MIRELLTKFSKISKVLDDWLDKLGKLGTPLAFLISLTLLFSTFLIPIWIIELLFPNFLDFGDDSSVEIVITLLAVAVYGLIHWLFFSKPKDYVASKISDDIYNILTELNQSINQVAKLGQKVEIKESIDQRCQYFSADFDRTSEKETDVNLDSKIRILTLLKKLNLELKKAKKRNLEVSIDFKYWEPEEIQESDLNQLYRFRFFANINPN